MSTQIQTTQIQITQKAIEKELRCKFVRVSNKDSHLWNCGYILKEFVLT